MTKTTKPLSPTRRKLRIANLAASLILIIACLVLVANYQLIEQYWPLLTGLFVVALTLMIANRIHERRAMIADQLEQNQSKILAAASDKDAK